MTSWFLVCCLSGREKHAADDIAHDLAFETFCPQLTKIKMVRGVRTRVVSALFQGYAFARFDRERDDWGRIRGDRWCHGYLQARKRTCPPSLSSRCAPSSVPKLPAYST